LIIAGPGSILTVTENGFGKRTKTEEYPVHGRGGLGVISIQASARNGKVVGAVQVDDNDELMLITDGGTLVRTLVDGVSILGRNTQGVTLIRLSKGEKLIGIDRIENLDDDESVLEGDSGEE
jgi:DNA gyrase subunit A